MKNADTPPAMAATAPLVRRDLLGRETSSDSSPEKPWEYEGGRDPVNNTRSCICLDCAQESVHGMHIELNKIKLNKIKLNKIK